MLFGCPISERINLEDGVVFGTEHSEIGEKVTCYNLQADAEDTPPTNVHTLDFPVEWPFLLDINDYDAKDEPSVRAINSISMAVVFMRSMSSEMSDGVKWLSTYIKSVERGHENPDGNVEGGVNKIHSAEKWRDSVQNTANEFSILADHCPSSRVTELEKWCRSTATYYEPVRNAMEECVVYNRTINHKGIPNTDVDSVIAEQQYVDELVNGWKEYEAATTDVDLEGIVDDIYSTMDPIEVSL